jgi:hypothetical protein
VLRSLSRRGVALSDFDDNSVRVDCDDCVVANPGEDAGPADDARPWPWPNGFGVVGRCRGVATVVNTVSRVHTGRALAVDTLWARGAPSVVEAGAASGVGRDTVAGSDAERLTGVGDPCTPFVTSRGLFTASWVRH